MKFHLSHGFVKGDTHEVCEDYATSLKIRGTDLSLPYNPLVIVSDGCSAVPNSDVGSRLLTLSAKKVMARVIADGETPEPDELGDLILQSLIPIAETLDAVDTCYATLLAGFVLDGQCHVYAYGDGLWYWRSRSGEMSFTAIEDVQNAPPYLIFRHDAPKLLVEPGKTAKRIRISEYPAGKTTMTRQELFHWSFPTDDVAEFGVATDGVFATNLDLVEVIEALSDGDIPYLLQRFRQTDPTCFDDIGIAAIRILHGA